jgi:glycosyltransferase involved in cell wall biosynthesis
MSDRISAIIPVYNGARFIRDALASLCAQTHPPAEIVVADDVSTDDTREVVAAFARTSPVKIDLFTLEKNTGGPYGPASRAFGRTTGDFVCILDADDLFAPDAFATYLSMFAAGPGDEVGLATADFMTFRDGTNETVMPSYFATQAILGRVLDDSPTGVLLDRDEAFRVYAESFAIPFKGMLRREAWAEMGGPNLAYRHACDVEFVWRFISRSRFRVRVLNRPLVRVRIWGSSMSSNRLLEGRELVKLFRDMLRTLPDPAHRATVRRRLRKELFDLTYNAYKRRSLRTLVPAAWGLAAARVGGLFRREAV